MNFSNFSNFSMKYQLPPQTLFSTPRHSLSLHHSTTQPPTSLLRGGRWRWWVVSWLDSFWTLVKPVVIVLDTSALLATFSNFPRCQYPLNDIEPSTTQPLRSVNVSDINGSMKQAIPLTSKNASKKRKKQTTWTVGMLLTSLRTITQVVDREASRRSADDRQRQHRWFPVSSHHKQKLCDSDFHRQKLRPLAVRAASGRLAERALLASFEQLLFI